MRGLLLPGVFPMRGLGRFLLRFLLHEAVPGVHGDVIGVDGMVLRSAKEGYRGASDPDSGVAPAGRGGTDTGTREGRKEQDDGRHEFFVRHQKYAAQKERQTQQDQKHPGRFG